MPDYTADDDHTTATELAPGAVRRERDLPAPADEAWELLRDADGLSRWLADDVDLAVAPGERGTLRDGDDERSVAVEEVEEGRRVALRWWTGDREDDATLVDLTLEPLGDDRSRLVVTEVPLDVVEIPDTVPAAWILPGAAAAGPPAGRRRGAGERASAAPGSRPGA